MVTRRREGIRETSGSSRAQPRTVRMTDGVDTMLSTPYLAMISHARVGAGWSRVPSYITAVSPWASGP